MTMGCRGKANRRRVDHKTYTGTFQATDNRGEFKIGERQPALANAWFTQSHRDTWSFLGGQFVHSKSQVSSR